ncbi:hypothetical protein ABT263_29390 [Kitasatospora sp. NPDC001603]|uniref:hypothetical protein n=1 Tax=Kitasatospora sp. NPDC001603 TaxID=3154388 RepID=UPI00332CB96A
MHLTGYRLTHADRRPLPTDAVHGPVEALAYGRVRETLDRLVADGLTHPIYCWEIGNSGRPDPSTPQRTLPDWRLVTIRNPAPQQHRIAHRAMCADDGLCACERTVPVPLPAWCNLFAGLTLSPLFHLHPADRARLTALQWPAPKDAEGWTCPAAL